MDYSVLGRLSGYSFSQPLLSTEIRFRNIAYLDENTIDFFQSHPYHEFILALQGTLGVDLDEGIVTIHQGELLHIGAQTTRKLKIYPDLPVQLLLLAFEPCSPSAAHTGVQPPWLAEERTLLQVLAGGGYHIGQDTGLVQEHVEHLCRLLDANRTGLATLLPLALTELLCACLQLFCQPGTSAALAPGQRQELASRISAINEYIRLHFSEPLSVQQAAAALNYSPRHLQRLIAEYYSTSFSDLLAQFRVGNAKTMLALTGNSMGSVAEQCGFCSLRVFERQFRRVVGLTPTQFRKKYGKCV